MANARDHGGLEERQDGVDGLFAERETSNVGTCRVKCMVLHAVVDFNCTADGVILPEPESRRGNISHVVFRVGVFGEGTFGVAMGRGDKVGVQRHVRIRVLWVSAAARWVTGSFGSKKRSVADLDAGDVECLHPVSQACNCNWWPAACG